MACRKAFDLDLVACLLDTGRPEWSEFRDHYPRCADCAAEVRTWTELQASLTPPHPTPQELLHFEERGSGLVAGARERIAGHVATCRSCRDELRALRAFDPRTVAEPVAVAPLAPGRASASTPKRRWWRSLGGIILHPAFAYGIALALLYPALEPHVRPFVVDRFAAGQRWESKREGGDVAARPPEAPPPPPAEVALAVKENAPAPADDPRVSGAPEADVLEERAATRADGAALMAKSAVPAAEPAAAASDDWPVIVLTSNREVALPRPEHGLVLRLAPPRSQPALPAGLAWLRVRDAAGRRELREQQFGMPGSATELRVPATWLEPGSYRADIVTGDDARPLATAWFRVEP